MGLVKDVEDRPLGAHWPLLSATRELELSMNPPVLAHLGISTGGQVCHSECRLVVPTLLLLRQHLDVHFYILLVHALVDVVETVILDSLSLHLRLVWSVRQSELDDAADYSQNENQTQVHVVNCGHLVELMVGNPFRYVYLVWIVSYDAPDRLHYKVSSSEGRGKDNAYSLGAIADETKAYSEDCTQNDEHKLGMSRYVTILRDPST